MYLKMFLFLVFLNICFVTEHYGIKTLSLLISIMLGLSMTYRYLKDIDK